MKVIYSYNESLSKRLVNFLKPSVEEVFLHFLLAFILLASFNYKVFVELITTDNGLKNLESLALADNLTVVLYRANASLGTVTVFVFWLVVGAIMYAVVWFVQSLYSDLHEDIEGSNAVNVSHDKESYWQSAGSKYIAFFSILIGSAGFLYFVLTILVPFFSKQAVLVLTAPSDVMSYVRLVLAIVTIAICFYLGRILLHIIRYSVGTFGAANK